MNAVWMPRRGGTRVTVRVGARREFLRIAAAMLEEAVKDLGDDRADNDPLTGQFCVPHDTAVELARQLYTVVELKISLPPL